MGVTYSFVAINASSDSMTKLNAAAKAGGGHAMNSSAQDLTITLKNDIRVPEIKDVEPGEICAYSQFEFLLRVHHQTGRNA